MLEIRFLNQDELKDAAQLADLIFRDAEHTSMGYAFPQIFSGDFAQSLGAFVDGKLVSFIGAVPQWIRIGGAALQVFSIGSVCTHPDYRGQGLAGQILEQAAEHMDRSGASLMLVSGDRSLYRRFGCYKFGEVLRYELTHEDAERIMKLHPPEEGVRFRQFEPSDWFGLHGLMRQKEVTYEQGLYETAQMIHRHPYAGISKRSHQINVAETDSGLKAYAIFALSTERSGNAVPSVLDWGGDAQTAVQLIAHTIAKLSLPLATFTSPWQETGIHALLKEVSHKARKNGGTVKILNYSSLWNQLVAHLREKDENALNTLNLKQSGELVQLTIDGESIKLAPENFSDLLFNPEWDIPELNDRKKQLGALFPIAFPYTEGLNYT